MNYKNFDLNVFEHKVTNGSERFKVQVTSSPAGEQSIADADKVSLPPDIRQRKEALKRRQFTLKEMIDFGEQLGKALFTPRIRSFFNASLNRLQTDGEGLRIRLRLDTYGLAELPWEYVYLTSPDMPDKRKGPEGFLALNRRISLSRYEIQEQPMISLDPGVAPIRMVALLASPDDPTYPPLDLAAERRSIAQALKDLPDIGLQFYPADLADHLGATTTSLEEALVSPAHIFHFSGHGEFKGDMGERYGSLEGAGSVILVGDDGHAQPFSAQKLALTLSGRSVRLAVLTACEVGQRDAASVWAGVVTALTHAGVPAVVGMQFRIRDNNAIAFSTAFYRALAAGQPIDAAVTDGRLAIFNRGDDNERDWGVPVLYLRAIDGVLFPKSSGLSGGAIGPSARVGNPASARVAVGQAPVNKRELREAMLKGFSSDELEFLCRNVQDSLADVGIELQVNLDVVGGGSKPMQVLNLIEYLSRRDYLDYLVKAVREARPGII